MKSLSPEDIAELKRGGGWGLAKGGGAKRPAWPPSPSRAQGRDCPHARAGGGHHVNLRTYAHGGHRGGRALAQGRSRPLENAFRANTVTEESPAGDARGERAKSSATSVHSPFRAPRHAGAPDRSADCAIRRAPRLPGPLGRYRSRWSWAGQALRSLLPGFPQLQDGPLPGRSWVLRARLLESHTIIRPPGSSTTEWTKP